MLSALLSPDLFIAYTLFVIGVASPGPSNLAIMGMAVKAGRKPALILATGITFGSLFWGILAALGLSAILSTFSSVLIAIKIVGGLYLLYFAYKIGKSALSKEEKETKLSVQSKSKLYKIFLAGAALHITNPKAIFVWISIMSISISTDSQTTNLFALVIGCEILGAMIFLGYATLFSTQIAQAAYLKLRRAFEGVLSVCFGFAGIKLLTMKL